MKILFRITLVAFLSIVLLVGGGILWFYAGIGLPKLSSLSNLKTAQNSKVFASDGTLLTELHGDENREVIALEKIPDHLQKAVISIEDSEFFHHSGISWKSVVRALWANVIKGTVVQGGSTITQQYVKNAYVGTRRTLWRKIQEANLAYQLENKYSKEKILELYLNDIYFGQGCYGIYTAARKYFGKVPEQLTLAECAMLAGIVRSPSYYDPYKIPQEVQERRNFVLLKMQQHGFITNDEAVAAMNEPVTLAPPNILNSQRQAPYFCDYMTDLVRRTYGDQAAFRGGVRIYTTIDLNLQHVAENVLARMLKPGSGPDAAIVCIDPRTGYVKAMVGGKNYATNQFNLAAQGHRQAGSAFKAFVLSRAIADGVSPERTYDSSSPRIINLPEGGKWVVNNYEGHGSGSMTLRSATIHSVNCVYAQLIMDVGPSRVKALAKQMGIMTDFQDNPAIALGGLSNGVTPLEMASAFGTLANNGIHAVPRSIYKATDVNGNVITENKPETHVVLDARVAAQVNDLLQEVVSSGTGRGASIGRPQAGKTGTTENHADAWFVGYTPDLVTAVWVGYPQGSISMGGMAGGDLPADIWAAFMRQALKNTPPTDFAKVDKNSNEDSEEQRPQQSETISVTVCDESGLLATPNCPHTHSQEYRRGQEPTAFCNIHKSPPANGVPNVVGMRKSTAVTTLQQAGFQAGIVEQPSNDQVAGMVLSQIPGAGTQLPSGSRVTIMISTGVIQRSVPNVAGMTELAAKGSILAAGFTPRVSYVAGTQDNVVVSQSPGPGTKLPVGTTISITVSKTGL